MMNQTPNNTPITLNATPISFEIFYGTSRLHLMRLDPDDIDEETCESPDCPDCSAIFEFQLTISDAPELTNDPEEYLLCRTHAANMTGTFFTNILA